MTDSRIAFASKRRCDAVLSAAEAVADQADGPLRVVECSEPAAAARAAETRPSIPVLFAPLLVGEEDVAIKLNPVACRVELDGSHTGLRQDIRFVRVCMH